LRRYRQPPPNPEHSWRVEAITKDGKRWRNGVCLGSREEAEAYAKVHVPARGGDPSL